jgi:serine/threonine protein kinase
MSGNVAGRRGKPPLTINPGHTADPAYLRDSNDCQELFKAFQPMLPADIEELNLIGSGAFSNVYRVNHRPTGRVYAVKRMSIPAQDVQKKQLVNEVNALAQLRHANIVPLISGFYYAKQLNIVMELVDGGSLCDYLKICPVIPEPVLGRITWFCLQGLYYLRQNHYLHRDLKPANILLSKIGTVQLADFGMARQLQNSIDTAFSFCGTFCYMAPEKATGQNYSFASDIWSLGLVVYEAALGRFPILSGQAGAMNLDRSKDRGSRRRERGRGMARVTTKVPEFFSKISAEITLLKKYPSQKAGRSEVNGKIEKSDHIQKFGILPHHSHADPCRARTVTSATRPWTRQQGMSREGGGRTRVDPRNRCQWRCLRRVWNGLQQQ